MAPPPPPLPPLQLSELPYSGVTSFFIRVLLDKKYALPHRVLDALVAHFTAFKVVGGGEAFPSASLPLPLLGERRTETFYGRPICLPLT